MREPSFYAASAAAVAGLLLAGSPTMVSEGPGGAASVVPPATVAHSHLPPRPDHVVVVVLENHGRKQILGNSKAPYINELAATGALMTRSHAITHPSQPNYLALFSGSTQGVTSDACPLSFSTPNFGYALRKHHGTFVGYSEDLPKAGSKVCRSGAYARKHAPWTNWTQLPKAVNQPFTAFPESFGDLPDVSYVIPNLDNDMHDGTVKQADTWLQANLGDYVAWARTHNSWLVLTFDEDEGFEKNLIPTILVGETIKPGRYHQRITHYDVLRTLEDAFGLPALGKSAAARGIRGIWYR